MQSPLLLTFFHFFSSFNTKFNINATIVPVEIPDEKIIFNPSGNGQ